MSSPGPQPLLPPTRHPQLSMVYLSLIISSHLSLNCEGRWGTTDDFATSFLHFSLFFNALWDLANSRPVHPLMLSCHLFLCVPCLLPRFTVPCKMVLARPNEQVTWPYHCSLRLFTMVRRSSCGPIACWILARTYSWVTCLGFFKVKGDFCWTNRHRDWNWEQNKCRNDN